MHATNILSNIWLPLHYFFFFISKKHIGEHCRFGNTNAWFCRGFNHLRRPTAVILESRRKRRTKKKY